MSNLSHTIREFNRFELKYLITLQQAERFKSRLQAYLVPDEHGGHDGRYAVSSLYYDSPGFRCYWEKLDGLKVRRKLRIRWYETGEVLTEETPIFLEIKQRVDRVTQKRRALLPYGEALRLCHDRHIPAHAVGDEAILEEICVFLWQYNLRPASIVRYDRQAFIGTDYDIGLRVTFDTSLSFQSHRLHLHEQAPGLPMLHPGFAVMEVKVNERIPYWLTEMIAAHNLQLIRFSKYCRSIEAAKKIPSTQQRIPTAESSQDVLASCLSSFSTLERKMGIRKPEDEAEKTEVSRGHFQHPRSDQ
jgi:SPX domain protein involved in polyphosphate accumulation